MMMLISRFEFKFEKTELRQTGHFFDHHDDVETRCFCIDRPNIVVHGQDPSRAGGLFFFHLDESSSEQKILVRTRSSS